VRLTDPAARPLVHGLSGEYAERYGSNDEMQAFDPADFGPPDGAFVLLVEAGRTVAGGGIRRLDPCSGELKRMWTAPTHRRRGLARLVLAELEDAARERGFRRLLLETGPAQPEAIRLYASAGFELIPGYGRYRDEPDCLSYAKYLDGRQVGV
jgi:GNAT superfamily N-acetyltransferase